MHGFRYHPAAKQELDEACAYYEAQQEGLARKFLDNYFAALDLIADHPKAGPDVGRGLRRVALSRFPFFVIYRLEADSIYLLAVAHQARRPRYWSSRS